MAENKKISELDAIASVAADDEFPVVDATDSTTKKATTTQIKNAVLNGVDSDDIPEGSTNLYFSSAEETKLAGIEAGADVTDAGNVIPAIATASIPTATVATDDKIIGKDTNDSDAVKIYTAQSIADLVSNATVIEKVLTGFSASPGVVSATDTILQAINKIQGNSTNTKLTTRTSCTVTGTMNTNTTYTGFYTRVGSLMILEVYIAWSGAPNVTNLRINLPSVEGSTNISNFSLNPIYGFGMLRDASPATQYYLDPEWQDATSVYIGAWNSAGTYLSEVTVNATTPITIANGDTMSLMLFLPITEWA